MEVYVLLEINYDWYNVIGAYKDKKIAESIKKEKEREDIRLTEEFDWDETEFFIQKVKLI